MRSVIGNILGFVLLTLLSTSVNSSPGVVFVPPITSPTSTSVRTGKSVQNVTWDVSNPPANITNKIGTILFRSADFTTLLILADNFDILLGTIEITVPWVLTGNDYSLNLIGDSGNFSPNFTIIQAD
ncbi:hypothetical protein GYMLUDRAFT_262130 [Collybiopsis luxurians FD-317 M1]|uniref:Uncharacterized protein n=1 Tax=Collybiopsis luxurians FD-317 M1 TaxID=944289 RepID=A0A0D0B7D5_9AGAR|nr:hypothetical protein GYMLUDRAFT_262130 [Collybiopsis luxurians FD-317 M1]